MVNNQRYAQNNGAQSEKKGGSLFSFFFFQNKQTKEGNRACIKTKHGGGINVMKGQNSRHPTKSRGNIEAQDAPFAFFYFFPEGFCFPQIKGLKKKGTNKRGEKEGDLFAINARRFPHKNKGIGAKKDIDGGI